jgi:hypothetical protein
LLLCSVALVGPADAVNIPGCGEFVIVARDTIFLEQGATMEIFGNLIVASQTGLIEVGRFNVIHGTVSANEIKFGNDAKIDGDPNTPEGRCEFNISSGVAPATVCDAIGPFVFPTCVPPALFNAPVVDVACINANPNFNVPPGGVATLNDGDCAKLLSLGAGAVLNVNGTVNVRNIQAGVGSRIVGPATINVQNGVTTGSGFQANGITFNIGGTTNGAVNFGNSSLFTNTLINVPGGGVHVRFNSVFVGNTEVIARLAIIEPITNEPPQPTPCPCVRTFTQNGLSLTLNGEELDFVQTVLGGPTPPGNCDPGAAGNVALNFTVVSPQQITVDLTGVPAGTYKVITTSVNGSCCTANTFTVP